MSVTRSHLIRAFVRSADVINGALFWLVAMLLLVMVFVVTAQIAVRFVLPPLGLIISLEWSDELARYLMIWCIFVGAAVATRNRDLIAMDTIPNLVAPKLATVIRAISYATTLGFFVFLIWLGVRWTEFGTHETSTVMQLPMSWVYVSLPIGAAVSILNISARLLEGKLTGEVTPAEADLA